jgi:hypothetical protein
MDVFFFLVGAGPLSPLLPETRFSASPLFYMWSLRQVRNTLFPLAVLISGANINQNMLSFRLVWCRGL